MILVLGSIKIADSHESYKNYNIPLRIIETGRIGPIIDCQGWT